MEYYILVANIDAGSHGDAAASAPHSASQRAATENPASAPPQVHRAVFTTAFPSPMVASGSVARTEGMLRARAVLRRGSASAAAAAGSGSVSSTGSGPGSLPHPLEEILQRAFSHISADSFITEFVRRTMDGQVRGNPPASKFAIENLAKGSGGQVMDSCAICQEDLTRLCKILQMPCNHCFHIDCLRRWLAEHNTCPVCRCEVESQCPRYNEKNYDKLKGKLDKVTVSNHADPSKIEPASFHSHLMFGTPTSSSPSTSSASPSGTSRTLRATIPMPPGSTFSWLMGNAASGGTPPTSVRPRTTARNGTTGHQGRSCAASRPISRHYPRHAMLPQSAGGLPSMEATALPESSMDFESSSLAQDTPRVHTSSTPHGLAFPSPMATPFGDARPIFHHDSTADFASLMMSRSPRSPPLPVARSSTRRGSPGQARASLAAQSSSTFPRRGGAGSGQVGAAAAVSAAASGRGRKRRHSPYEEQEEMGGQSGTVGSRASNASSLTGSGRLNLLGRVSVAMGLSVGEAPKAEEDDTSPVARRTRQRSAKGPCERT